MGLVLTLNCDVWDGEVYGVWTMDYGELIEGMKDDDGGGFICIYIYIFTFWCLFACLIWMGG